MNRMDPTIHLTLFVVFVAFIVVVAIALQSAERKSGRRRPF